MLLRLKAWVATAVANIAVQTVAILQPFIHFLNPEWFLILISLKTNPGLFVLSGNNKPILDLFLHRHVCPDLLEEESPGGEAPGWGEDSRLYPYHCSDSSTSAHPVHRRSL